MDSKSNITQEKKEEYLNEIIKQFGQIPPTIGFTDQMKAMMKIADYIGNIYEDGFNKGFEEGKKLGLNMFKNN